MTELTKVLGIVDREGHSGRERLAKAKTATAAERELKAAMLAFSDKDSGWVADARAKLKGGAAPGNVFLTLVQLEVDGSEEYVAAAKKLRVRGCA